MFARDLNVLVLGSVPEFHEIFDREIFRDDMPVEAFHVMERADFQEALDRADTYDLVLIDITPDGLEVLEEVRTHRPACPVVMIGDAAETSQLLAAKRKGLEAYVLRGPSPSVFTDLVAEEIYTQLKRFVEPPTMESPSAEQMYRYAQFYNVLEPFFVVSRRRYLLYANHAGRNLVASMSGREPHVGDPVQEWSLSSSQDFFSGSLDRGFAGHEMICEQFLETSPEGGELVELHFQPVTDPQGRVVAVSVAVGQAGRPARQRARVMQELAGLAAMVSHENNNLLSVLMSNASLLAERLEEWGDEEASRRIEKIEGAIDRAAVFTAQLQALSQTSVSQPEPIDLSEFITDLRSSLTALVGPRVQIEVELEGNLPHIEADREHWQTVVTTLVENAARNMGEGGPLEIRTRSLRVGTISSAPVGPGRFVVLEASYRGESIVAWSSEETFTHTFGSYSPGRHAGLELATVRSIVEQGGGRVVTERDGDQAVLRVYYPVADQAPAEAQSPPKQV